MVARLIRSLPILLSFAALPAHAMDFSLRQSPEPAILASGEITTGDAARFEALVSRLRPRPSVVYFASNGGLIVESMKLGLALRSAGFASRIGPGATCASACVFAFLGGVIREVDGSARVGVHMASLMFVDDYVEKLKSVLLNTSLPLDDRIRLIVAINEQRAARMANAETSYLMKMGVSLKILRPITDNLQIEVHWLTRRELREYNVVNVE